MHHTHINTRNQGNMHSTALHLEQELKFSQQQTYIWINGHLYVYVYEEKFHISSRLVFFLICFSLYSIIFYLYFFISFPSLFLFPLSKAWLQTYYLLCNQWETPFQCRSHLCLSVCMYTCLACLFYSLSALLERRENNFPSTFLNFQLRLL